MTGYKAKALSDLNAKSSQLLNLITTAHGEKMSAIQSLESREMQAEINAIQSFVTAMRLIIDLYVPN